MDRVGYLHIPKSAGTSLVAALRASFPEDAPFTAWFDRCLYASFDDYDQMTPETQARFYLGDGSDLGRYAVIAGHFSRQTIAATLPPAQIFTVIREPRVRLLSHYFFWRSLPIERHRAYLPYDGQLRAIELGLAEFLSVPWLAPQTDNILTRMLLFPNRRLPAVRFIADLDPLTRVRIRRRAGQLLDDFGFVAPLELGDPLASGIARWLGRPFEIPHLNRTERTDGPDITEHLTPDVWRLLDRRTVVDRVLWDAACRRTGLDPVSTATAAVDAYVASMTPAG